MPDINFTDKLARMLGVKPDAIQHKLADLDVDQILELVDAAGHGNADTARSVLDMGAGAQDEADDQGEAIDDQQDGEDVEAGDDESNVEADAPEEPVLNPLFARGDGKAKKRPEADAEVEEGADEGTPYEPNLGDTITVAGHEGTVNMTNGPGDTVGVLIDGEKTVVDKGAIRRGGVNESVMGMTAMLDLNRMRALAGLGPMSDTPLGAGRVPVIDFEPEDDEADVEQMTAPAVEIEGPCMDAPANDEPSQPGDQGSLLDDPKQLAAIVAAGTTSAHYPESPCLDFGGVLQSFDEIERAMPELRVRDAKEVRNRINGLLAKLNETAFVRGKKV